MGPIVPSHSQNYVNVVVQVILKILNEGWKQFLLLLSKRD